MPLDPGRFGDRADGCVAWDAAADLCQPTGATSFCRRSGHPIDRQESRRCHALYLEGSRSQGSGAQSPVAPLEGVAWRTARQLCGPAPAYVREHARGRWFADIGCMWGVNGGSAFIAEEAGATTVKAVDLFGPTPEFEQAHRQRRSQLNSFSAILRKRRRCEQIGPADVVLCAGVLYHHPSPFDLLVALRRICRRALILRSATIPEIPGLPNAAVFYPGLSKGVRRLWNLESLGVAHHSPGSRSRSTAQTATATGSGGSRRAVWAR